MATGAVYPEIVEGGSPPPQNPSIWDALDVLRGGPHVPDDQVTDLLTNAKPDVDYPVLSDIPDVKSFSCVNVKQAGYYADTDYRYLNAKIIAFFHGKVPYPNGDKFIFPT